MDVHHFEQAERMYLSGGVKVSASAERLANNKVFLVADVDACSKARHGAFLVSCSFPCVKILSVANQTSQGWKVTMYFFIKCVFFFFLPPDNTHATLFIQVGNSINTDSKVENESQGKQFEGIQSGRN